MHEPPEPPYARPSIRQRLLDRRPNALSFRTLSAHSPLRPDLIAAGIATKSTADVAVYLSLFRDGASSSGAVIARGQQPAAHEVSAELAVLEEKHAARICVAEPARSQEAVREVRNGMRVRHGDGAAQGGRAR